MQKHFNSLMCNIIFILIKIGLLTLSSLKFFIFEIINSYLSPIFVPAVFNVKLRIQSEESLGRLETISQIPDVEILL